MTHHFIQWDDINSYLKRCIPSKMSENVNRSHAISICLSEYRYKKQKKQMKK